MQLCPILCSPCPILVKFSAGYFYANMLSFITSFFENLRGELGIFVANANEFLPLVVSTFIFRLVWHLVYVYPMLLCVSDFRKNWPTIERIFLMGLNEMACVYRETA
jgi:hypothetical protein